MSVNATLAIKTPAIKTPLDYLAESYWQDFLAQRAIAGGMAYEQQLHACQLDESLLSLQRIDILLSQIRRDIIKSSGLNEALVLADERYRHLFIFIAFYAGRVLARQWRYMPNWYGQFALAKRYPDLSLADGDFYQHMAVIYADNTDYADNKKAIAGHDARAMSSLFFALEPIGQRLFGNIDRQFLPVQGGQVASGLYQAVVERLPNTVAKPSITAPKSTNSADINSADINSADISFADNGTQSIAPTPKVFTQLLADLASIEVTQDNGNEDYHQACKILDQFERHIARQNTPRSEIKFSPAHQEQRQQALVKLQASASVGNTSAMLRLAMYELLGEGLSADNHADADADADADSHADKKASKDAGIERVKQAANAQDSRGQRLLSRLYYQGFGQEQGFGVEQDMQSGRHWLEQAAKNGHSEAAVLVAEWQQAQALMTTHQQEQHSTKRYQLLIIVVIIAAIALIVFV